MKKTTSKYIANGHTFYSYEDVEKYAEKNGYRITNTVTIKKGFTLISLTSINN